MKAANETVLPFSMRPANAEDAEFLFELYCTSREDELNAAGFPLDQRKQFLRMQFNAQTFHYDQYYADAVHRIITADQRPVGRELVYRTKDEILLVDLLLLPEFCNRGIGTVLLKKLFAESTKVNLPIHLHALSVNELALRLYKRLGFRTIGEEGLYLLLEWQAEDPKASANTVE